MLLGWWYDRKGSLCVFICYLVELCILVVEIVNFYCFVVCSFSNISVDSLKVSVSMC